MISEQLREEFATLLRNYVSELTVAGAKVIGRVPWRSDEHPSFSADLEKCVWYDLARKEGGGVKEFKVRLGLNGATQPAKKIAAVYDYTDETGVLLFQVVRYELKGFSQRRPGVNRDWIYNLSGVRRVLYHLPDVLKAETVYLAEGEKDADRLRALGIPATTNPGGAGKWREEYNEILRGKKIVILPDYDEVGEQHALAVARALLLVADVVKVVRLPGLPQKGDISDWLDAGHTKDELAALVRGTSPLQEKDLQSAQEPNAHGLSLTRLGDLLKEPEEQVNWLVDKMLPAGGLSVVVAKPKVGKTTLVRNLALTVATGGDFLGKAVQQGPVVYLALEEKRAEVRKHFQDMGASGEEAVYIFAASAPLDALQRVRVEVEEKKPVLLIIDPLFRFTRVKDGNDYAQITAALEPLLVLARETGTHVLCVHHAGKNEKEGLDSILGSTAIAAAVDTALLMKRSDRYRTVSSIQRYGEDLPETVLQFDPTTRVVNLGETKDQEEGKRIEAAILDCLTTQERDKEKGHALTQAELDEEIEGRTTYKRRALKALVDGKQIERLGKGGKKDPFRYCLKNSCFLVPSTFREHGNKNQKTNVSPGKNLSYSCSQDSPPSANPAKAPEQESAPYEDEI